MFTICYTVMSLCWFKICSKCCIIVDLVQVLVCITVTILCERCHFETFLISCRPLPPPPAPRVDSELIERGGSSYYSCTITDVIMWLNPPKWPFMPRARFEVSSKMEKSAEKRENTKANQKTNLHGPMRREEGEQWRAAPPSSPIFFM